MNPPQGTAGEPLPRDGQGDIRREARCKDPALPTVNRIPKGDKSILQHLIDQNNTINYLAGTVDELRNMMGKMNETLTKLQCREQAARPAPENSSQDQFDLVATVLGEIRSKDDKVERLKLKNDVLALKIRYLEEKYAENGAGDLSNHPSDDYFDDNSNLENPRPVKVPLKGCDGGSAANPNPLEPGERREGSQRPEVQVQVRPRQQQVQRKRRSTSNTDTESAAVQPEQPPTKPPAKKPKRSSSQAPAPEKLTPNQPGPAKRGRGRSRKSSMAGTAAAATAKSRSAIDLTEKQPSEPHVPASSSTSNLSTATTAKEAAPGTQQRRRSTRSATRRSRPSTPSPVGPATADVPVIEDGAEHDDLAEVHDEQERKRKEKIAARDKMVELAMRREEAMMATG